MRQGSSPSVRAGDTYADCFLAKADGDHEVGLNADTAEESVPRHGRPFSAAPRSELAGGDGVTMTASRDRNADEASESLLSLMSATRTEVRGAVRDGGSEQGAPVQVTKGGCRQWGQSAILDLGHVDAEAPAAGGEAEGLSPWSVAKGSGGARGGLCIDEAWVENVTVCAAFVSTSLCVPSCQRSPSSRTNTNFSQPPRPLGRFAPTCWRARGLSVSLNVSVSAAMSMRMYEKTCIRVCLCMCVCVRARARVCVHAYILVFFVYLCVRMHSCTHARVCRRCNNGGCSKRRRVM